MTIRALYPSIEPTLDLNFALSKRLDPRVTFTRGSAGTYFDKDGILKTAAANQPRFDHNPSTKDSLGLLVEESRINRLAYSSYPPSTSTATTMGSNCLTAINSAVAPDGTLTAYTLDPSGFYTYVGIDTNSFSVVSGTTYTASIWVKKIPGITYQNLSIVVNDWATPSAVNFSSQLNASTDWIRVSASFTSNVTAGRGIWLVRQQSGSSVPSQPLYVWGAQIEEGSFVTSYIPTPATFTSRASTATYYDANGIVQTAASGVARNDAYFPDSNGTMRSAGLLLEAAGTNELTQSQTFSTWTLGNASITTNATTSPDGTNNASKLIEDNTTNIHRISLSINPTGTYTLSVFAKAAERSILTLMPASTAGGDTPVYFDLAAGTISASLGSANSASIQKFPNGWYRCSVTDSMGGFGYPFIGVAAVSGTQSYAGNGTSGIFIWGAQLEASPWATSYIPTTTATVTRAADVSTSATVTRSADVASITGTNFSSWYNQNEGSVFADITDIGYPTNALGSLWKIFASTSHVSGRNSINLSRYSGGALPEARFGIIDQNATTVVDLNTPTSPTRARVKSAIGLKSASYAATSHGNTAVTSSTAVPPTYVAADTLAFGQATNSTSQAKSCLISRLTYWPVRLSDAILQSITL